MKIDRHNYEEFFILYLDNELPAGERAAVEAFAAENADLKAELELLMNSKLSPDQSLVFEEKDDLLKTGGFSSISLHNYEEWLVAYADNELTVEQKLAVESFIRNHSALQNELTLLLRTKLEPESIIFPYKESLYRKEERAAVIPINWKKYAAAAAIILAIGTTAFFALRRKENPDNTREYASGTQPVNTKKNITTPVKEHNEEVTNEERNNKGNTAQTHTDLPVKNELAQVTRPQVVVKERQRVQQEQLTPEAKDQPEKLLAVNDNKVKVSPQPTNNLPQPHNNPNVIAGSGNVENNTTDLASNDATEHSLTNSQGKNLNIPVTTSTDGALDYASNPQQTNDEPALEPAGNKNKLRGFFRKLTRTFEKNTNIKATDEEDRLLVGGLAIRL